MSDNRIVIEYHKEEEGKYLLIRGLHTSKPALSDLVHEYFDANKKKKSETKDVALKADKYNLEFNHSKVKMKHLLYDGTKHSVIKEEASNYYIIGDPQLIKFIKKNHNDRIFNFTSDKDEIEENKKKWTGTERDREIIENHTDGESEYLVIRNKYKNGARLGDMFEEFKTGNAELQFKDGKDKMKHLLHGERRSGVQIDETMDCYTVVHPGFVKFIKENHDKDIFELTSDPALMSRNLELGVKRIQNGRKYAEGMTKHSWKESQNNYGYNPWSR